MNPNPVTVRQVSARLARSYGFVAGAFWAIMIVLLVVVETLVLVFADDPSSVWQGFRWAPQYFLLFMGVMLVTTYLPIQVAHGITRSIAIRAGSLIAVVISVAFAVVLELGFLAERGLYNALGLVQFPDSIDLVASPERILLSITEFSVLYLAYFVGGWAIAAGFYRFGGWIGTLMIAPAAAPALLAEMSQWNGAILGEAHGHGQAWLAAAVVTALVALLWIYTRALVRTAPISAK